MSNYIDSTGLNHVTYAELRRLKEVEYQTAIGSEVSTEPESVLGQLISINTQAETELMTFISTMLSTFDPNTAQGDFLSHIAVIMNKRRNPATFATVDIEVVSGSTALNIAAGDLIISDSNGNEFVNQLNITLNSNAFGLFQFEGVIEGNVTADIGAINEIITPILGLKQVRNLDLITDGIDREPDSKLRARCLTTSSAITSTRQGIYTALHEIDTVTDVKLYINNDDHITIDGITPHTIYAVIAGGLLTEIDEALLNSVAAGIRYSDHGEVNGKGMTDSGDLTRIKRPDPYPIRMTVRVKKLRGYRVGVTGNLIKDALVAHFEGLSIETSVGVDIYGADLICVINSVIAGIGTVRNIDVADVATNTVQDPMFLTLALYPTLNLNDVGIVEI